MATAAEKLTPSADDMDQAAEWLEMYEATEDDDAGGPHRVAAWLRRQAEAIDERAVAKRNGVPVRVLRAAIAKAESQS